MPVSPGEPTTHPTTTTSCVRLVVARALSHSLRRGRPLPASLPPPRSAPTRPCSLPTDDHVIPEGVDHVIPDLVLGAMVPSITSFRQRSSSGGAPVRAGHPGPGGDRAWVGSDAPASLPECAPPLPRRCQAPKSEKWSPKGEASGASRRRSRRPSWRRLAAWTRPRRRQWHRSDLRPLTSRPVLGSVPLSLQEHVVARVQETIEDRLADHGIGEEGIPVRRGAVQGQDEPAA